MSDDQDQDEIPSLASSRTLAPSDWEDQDQDEIPSLVSSRTLVPSDWEGQDQDEIPRVTLRNKIPSRTSFRTLQRSDYDDDTSSEASSDLLSLLSRPTSPENEVPTIGELVQQVRRLEVEEHAKIFPSIPPTLRGQLNAVLLHVEFFEPLMCLRSKPLLVASLVHLIRAMKEHIHAHPSFHVALPLKTDKKVDKEIRMDYWKALRAYTGTCIIWFLTCIRAELGFKQDKRMHQQICSLEHFIQRYSFDLEISWDEAKACSVAIPRDLTQPDHPLFAVGPRLGDILLDNFVGNMSSIHSRAVEYIYGVNSTEAEVAARFPGMEHALNLRAAPHFIPDVMKIPIFYTTVLQDAIAAVSTFKEMQEGSSLNQLLIRGFGKSENPTRLEMLISRLERYEIRLPEGQKGPALLIRALVGPEKRRCFLRYDEPSL